MTTAFFHHRIVRAAGTTVHPTPAPMTPGALPVFSATPAAVPRTPGMPAHPIQAPGTPGAWQGMVAVPTHGPGTPGAPSAPGTPGMLATSTQAPPTLPIPAVATPGAPVMHTLPLDPTQQGFGFRQQLRAVSEVLMSIPRAQQPTWHQNVVRVVRRSGAK